MAIASHTTKPLAELQVVELTSDLPEHGLHTADRGTVVMVYDNGAGYEVEFVDDDGFTRALLTLKQGQVRRVGRPVIKVHSRVSQQDVNIIRDPSPR
jgi:hypothetical protein